MVLKGFPKGEVPFFGVQEFFLGKSLVVFLVFFNMRYVINLYYI